MGYQRPDDYMAPSRRCDGGAWLEGVLGLRAYEGSGGGGGGGRKEHGLKGWAFALLSCCSRFICTSRDRGYASTRKNVATDSEALCSWFIERYKTRPGHNMRRNRRELGGPFSQGARLASITASTL